MIISDRFTDELRDTLARLIEERKTRLVLSGQTNERNAGFIQGLEEALRVADDAAKKLNQR